jgi:hypothetical protein
MNNNVVKLESNKIIEAQFCFEVECDFCKTSFIIIPNDDKRLECCPYCGHNFYEEPEQITYSHGVYGDIRSIAVPIRQNRISIESMNVDSIETNNAYSVECESCGGNYIIDCGEDKKPSFCPYCKVFYVADEFIRKFKTNNEFAYDYARFGSFPHIVYDMDVEREFPLTMTIDRSIYDDN